MVWYDKWFDKLFDIGVVVVIVFGLAIAVAQLMGVL